jgi:DNA-binding transcriptional ArsR family regulator
MRKLPHDHHDSLSCDQILEAMPSAEAIGAVSEALKQLGDPSRLRIFWLLCHTEECVADIAAYMEMSSPAVSHHLRLLKTAGLISSRRDGKEMLYRAADSDLAGELHHIIERIAEISCPS